MHAGEWLLTVSGSCHACRAPVCRGSNNASSTYNDAVRSTVVTAGDGAEALLPCRIPLQAHKGQRSALDKGFGAASLTQKRVHMLLLRHNNACTYDLQLDHFPIQLHGADFLQKGERMLASTGEEERLQGRIPDTVAWGQPITYEIHTNSADIALGICVILQEARSCQDQHLRHVRQDTKVAGDCMIWEAKHTAKRSSRHDLPTPESPISRSCGITNMSEVFKDARSLLATQRCERSSP